MDKDTQKPQLSPEQAKALLWRRGNLSWKLGEHQKSLYDLYKTTSEKINVWLCSRRFGKSHTLCVLAIEECLKNPHTIVKFVAPAKTQLMSYIEELMVPILSDCPDDLKPEFISKNYTFVFNNGSKIQLAGSNNKHAEKLRGGAAKLCIVDEAGTCTSLDYLVRSILRPTTLTTNGKIILASTPPPDEEHDFYKFVEEAEAKNTLVRKTIFDNQLLTPEQLKKEIEDAGGEHTEYFRREYLCHLIKDSSTTIIPEFNDDLAKAIVKEWPRPPFYDCYVSMDLGGATDLTVVLFSYYDFRANKIIIEDELVILAQEQDYVPKLIEGIIKKEKELWTNPITGEVKTPYMRISDINFIATSEIYRQSTSVGYPLNFISAKKDDRDTAINNLRVLLSSGKIIINPKCTTLIRHLKNGKWKPNKKDFARSPDNGHYDAIPAAYYLTRHIVFNRNPYPADYNFNMQDLYVRPGSNPFVKPTDQNMANVLKKLFNIKR